MSQTTIKTKSETIIGRSLGGFYTSLFIPEYKSLFDVGTAFRAGASARNLFLSHAHADHLGALPSLLGMRGLMGVKTPLRIFLPEELADDLPVLLDIFSKMHRWTFDVELVPLGPGDISHVHGDLWVRAIRTLHPVPSLGYVLFRRVKKLKVEYMELPGAEIGRLRRSGNEEIFNVVERKEFAYFTDTLPDVLSRNPDLFDVRTLVLECTFLNQKKSVQAARAGCHIHLDELLGFFSEFRNEAVVLMHFSQLYSPGDVREIFDARCPPDQRSRFHLLLPDSNQWWD